jgi:hypothetical protein
MNNTNHHDSGANPQPDVTTLTKFMVESIHAMIVSELESKTRKSSSSGYGTGESVAAEDISAQSAMLEARFCSFKSYNISRCLTLSQGLFVTPIGGD